MYVFDDVCVCVCVLHFALYVKTKNLAHKTTQL